MLPSAGFGGGVGFAPAVTDQLEQVTEVGEISSFGIEPVQIDGGSKQISGFDVTETADLMEVELVAGEFVDTLDTIFVQEDSAEDRGVTVGDTLDVTFRSGEVVPIMVGGIYKENAFFTNYLIDNSTLDAHTERRSDFGALAKIPRPRCESDPGGGSRERGARQLSRCRGAEPS